MVWCIHGWFRVNGRHALVTGGGRGIGLATAAALSSAGARVTVLGRDAAALQNAVRAGHAASWHAVDVTDADALHAALALAETEGGPLHILVNNAGAAETAPLARTGRDLWDRSLLLNLTAVYEACRAVLPGMMARGAGRIVSIASTAGLTGYPYVSAYCAAKHGVIGLTRALAMEAARSGVTVNAVCPGYTDTGLVDRSAAAVAAKTGRDPADVKSSYARSNPQGRLVQPDEVAAAVLFLCGAGSDAMTGQAITVAGGELM